MNSLITAADIKTYTAASVNVEGHRLEVTIPEATQRYLRPLLGVALLSQLLAFVVDAPEPPALTPDMGVPAKAQAQATYATALAAWRTANAGPLLVLWDQVKPCLAQWALVEAWPSLLVHVTEAGVVLKTGNTQGTTSADAATLGQVAGHHRETAIWRGNELVSWLEAHRADYPAYVSTRPAPTNAQPIDLFGGLDLS